MSLELFPQSVQLLPNDRLLFSARAKDKTPMWTRLVGGVVRPNASVAQSIPTGGASQSVRADDGAQHLVGGVGSFEFTIDANCLPVTSGATGHFGWIAFFGGPTGPQDWAYEVDINPASVVIEDELSSTLATLVHNVAVGDRFKVELNNGFRLFINGVLRHERVSGFAGGIRYPAFFGSVFVTKPTGTGTPIIPAPLLLGDWQLRPKDRLNNPVVIFTTPSHGSLAAGANDLQKEYFNGTIPGAYKLAAKVDVGVEIWVEDGAPSGSTVSTGGGAWAWSAFIPPVPFSSNLYLRGPVMGAAEAFYYFFNATRTLQINQGDVMTCYVWLEAANPPSEILIQWQATDSTALEHRAFWGADLISVGTLGTPSRRFMGALPPTGQWVRLEVAASLVDLEGRVLNGMSVSFFGPGQAHFDQGGKFPGDLQRAEGLITIPPLQILGALSQTLQPGQVVRFQTNYDVAQSALITFSVIGGGGSFSQGEFTAPTAPGPIVIRATVNVGNQVADLALNVPAVITPNFFAAAPLEAVDWDTNIPVMPAYVGAGTIAEGVGDITPGLPLGIQADDILVLYVESANETVPTPSGYTAVADSPQGTGTAGDAAATRLSAFWRRATASEVAPTITDPGDHAIAQILAFRNCITTGNPWDVTAGDTGASNTAVSIPGDTTTVPNCLIVQAVSNGTDNATPQTSGYTNAALANIAERTDVNSTQGNGGGFAVITGEKAVAGAFGATTATLATASTQGRITIALKPALITWSASAGSINSSSGSWTAPSLAGQTAKITVTNGTFTAVRDVLILEAFPFSDFILPMTWDRNLNALVSMSEDRTSRIVREKAPPFDSYPIRLVARTLAESNAVDAFFDAQGLGKPFILEDKLRGIRKVGWFDSPIRHEARDECDIDLSFQFLEARI